MSSRSSSGNGPGRVLWGRVAFTGALLLLAFLLGRWSVDAGVEQARYDEAQRRIAELEQENRDLAAGRVAVAAGGIDTPPAGEEAEDTGAAPEAAGAAGPTPTPPAEQPPAQDQPPAGGQQYTVQEGDTLQSIAQRVYGDGTKFPLIEQANNVDSTNLRVGATLTIPPDDSGE